ncbi:LOW QUALITY PROTEIN: signal recognition particle receptor subunit beta-like [Dreissena polymorpha]|uniref:LOW QUALITY PROTEIN: signal recognition particle receptor subunit beta-like n=1 Tax=Dreissena polymorpha TaxID=45954 RepID=UPI0022649187|nr:LOW QUALITY PROTEIN: signal recognition particle receptor subunit beta-like [Dreissena polymorpha]
MAAPGKNHVVVWMNYLKNAMEEGDYSVFAILAAVVIGILTFILFGVFKKRHNNRRGVLILGSCDAGKTLLYTQLIYKKHKPTFSSMSANSGSYTFPENGKTLRLIDLPGHERIRQQMLDTYKELARGIIFVIDSSTVQKEIKDFAEYLYTVLSDSRISSMCPPVLVACNKQDLTFTKGAKVIQGLLEKEINTLRITKSAALQDISAGNNNTFLGRRDRDFSFVDMKPMKIEFVECSATGGEAGDKACNLQHVQTWLAKIA